MGKFDVMTSEDNSSALSVQYLHCFSRTYSITDEHNNARIHANEFQVYIFPLLTCQLKMLLFICSSLLILYSTGTRETGLEYSSLHPFQY